MSPLITGVIHGRVIELSEDVGLPDGQEVQVSIQAAPAPREWGEGIRKTAGAWEKYPELDAVFDEIQRDRKRERGTTTDS